MKLKRLIVEKAYCFDKIEVQLDAHDLVQVTGINKDEERKVNIDDETENYSNVNGIGKTNIYNSIIQALYSRDIYKTKKSFLKNMFAKGAFKIILELAIDNTDYTIEYTNETCILYKEKNVYLSGRAAVTDFFETLIPFELFLHLTYISSTITFPFFSATPAQQKQFIELVFSDLNKFKESIPKLKERLSEEIKTKATIQTQLEIYTEQANIDIDSLMTVVEVPEVEDISDQKHNIKTRIQRLEDINKDQQNIKNELSKSLKEVAKPSVGIKELQERQGKGKGIIEVTKTDITKLEKVSTDSVCTLCGSEIDIATNQKLLKEKETYLETLKTTLKTVRLEIEEAEAQEELYTKYQEKVTERKLLKDKLNGMVYDEQEYSALVAQVLKLEQAQERQSNLAKEAQEQREEAIAHNSKVKVDSASKKEAQEKLIDLEKQDTELTSTITDLKLLIEICDKVIIGKQIPKRLEILERFINIELANFTSQYTVKLEMINNKIKPSVIKEGKTYPVENISTGEKARINISLIFAIRNILTRLRKEVYNINLLYVDEILGVLDFSGKHLLMETLLKYNLNIFLVSHDYTFPDIELLTLLKDNNKTVII